MGPTDTLHPGATQEKELKEFNLLTSVDLLEDDYEAHGDFTRPVEKRILQEEMTHIAEGINGRLVTNFRYGYQHGRVVAADGTPLYSMATNGVRTAEFDANKDPRNEYHLRRARHDLKEAGRIEDMMAGRTRGNTIMSFSLFPEEAQRQFGDEFVKQKGYQPDRKLAFIRLYHKTKDGLDATTIAIDNSYPEIFRRMAARRGVNIPPGTHTSDFLKYLIEQDLTDKEFDSLKTELAREYDQALSQKLGETTHFGRRESESQVDVWKFVQNNMELIDHHLTVLKGLALRRHGVMTPELEEFIKRSGSNPDDLSIKRNSLYMTWAAIKARFNRFGNSDPTQYTGGDLMTELVHEGHIAMENLEMMLGCGGGVMGDLEEEMMRDLLLGDSEKRDKNAIYRTGYCKFRAEDGCPARGGVTRIGDCAICIDCVKRF